MKVFYWSPHYGNIATINAVKYSVDSLNKYSNSFYECRIINAVGEWEDYAGLDYNLINLSNNNFYKLFPKFGYFSSRLFSLFVFIKCFSGLKKLIYKEKPDFLIIHLITALPLLLLVLFNFRTKFILRISGYPKLNIFRKFLWKLVSNKIYIVTAPSIPTLNLLINKKIFNKEKVKLLNDPVFKIRSIIKLKYENCDFNIDKLNSYIVSIGRLTEQKNFKLLIEAFFSIKQKYPYYKLIIIGDGEKRNALLEQAKKLNLINDIVFLGYVNNVYKYLNIADCFISTSLWEDPGFAIIESGILNKIIISSDCPNSPKELLGNGQNGFLFKNNSKVDLLEKFEQFKNEISQKIKLINAKKNFHKYSFFRHYSQINKLLNNIN